MTLEIVVTQAGPFIAPLKRLLRKVALLRVTPRFPEVPGHETLKPELVMVRLELLKVKLPEAQAWRGEEPEVQTRRLLAVKVNCPL